METKAQCAIHQAIVRLTAEIQRIRQAQSLIARADRALKDDRDDVLRKMGFGSEHIKELKQSVALSKSSAFPKFVRRNNAATVGYLRREVATLQRHLCTCSACTANTENESPLCTNSDESGAG